MAEDVPSDVGDAADATGSAVLSLSLEAANAMLMITVTTVMTSQRNRPIKRMCFVRFSG